VSAVREPRLRLLGMIEAADKILERKPADRRAVESDEMLQVWCFYQIQVIGEAAAHVPDEIRAAHPEVRWAALTGMRNRMVHDYVDIDLDVVWEVVVRDIPVLREQIAGILEQIEREDASQ